MSFQNPIANQPIAQGTSQKVVQSSEIGSLAQAVSTGMSAFAEFNKPAPVDTAALKMEIENEGHAAAMEVVNRYMDLKATDPKRAEVELTKMTQSYQTSLGADGAESFRKTLNANLGKNAVVNERESAMQLQTEQERREAETRHQLLTEGLELAAGDAQLKGIDPSSFSEDTLMGMALAARGVKARVAQSTADLALKANTLGYNLNVRAVKSEAAIVSFTGQQESSIQTNLRVFAEALKKYPANAEALKLQFLSALEQARSQIGSNSTAFISKAGGDPSDIQTSQLEQIDRMYDATIKLVRGDYEVDLLKTNIDMLTNGTALNVIQKMEPGFGTFVLTQNALRMPINALQSQVEAVGRGGAIYNSQAQQDLIARLGQGIPPAQASSGIGVPYAVGYSTMADSLDKVLRVKDPQVRAGGADALINTYQEAMSPSKRIRDTATEPDALPALQARLARSKGDPLAQEILAAAERDGTNPKDVWVQANSAIIREKLYPQLTFDDPAVIGSLDVKYSNGQFVVSVNDKVYRSKLERPVNLTTISGMDQTEVRIRELNRKLQMSSKILTDAARSYSVVTGASPDDVGKALEEQMKVTFKIIDPARGQ